MRQSGLEGSRALGLLAVLPCAQRDERKMPVLVWKNRSNLHRLLTCPSSLLPARGVAEDEGRCLCGAVQAARPKSGTHCPGRGGISSPDHSTGLQPTNHWSLPSPKPVQRDTDCTDNPVHLLAPSFSSSSSSALSCRVLLSISIAPAQ